jgi:hypothetical protein
MSSLQSSVQDGFELNLANSVEQDLGFTIAITASNA